MRFYHQSRLGGSQACMSESRSETYPSCAARNCLWTLLLVSFTFECVSQMLPMKTGKHTIIARSSHRETAARTRHASVPVDAELAGAKAHDLGHGVC